MLDKCGIAVALQMENSPPGEDEEDNKDASTSQARLYE